MIDPKPGQKPRLLVEQKVLQKKPDFQMNFTELSDKRALSQPLFNDWDYTSDDNRLPVEYSLELSKKLGANPLQNDDITFTKVTTEVSSEGINRLLLNSKRLREYGDDVHAVERAKKRVIIVPESQLGPGAEPATVLFGEEKGRAFNGTNSQAPSANNFMQPSLDEFAELDAWLASGAVDFV